ncbi:hypothetical protein [Acetobacter fallax]|uniref:GNAT family N-acetyltransferase n=1 Tax=Acetobacter fallax TaxID=1737473 RepID=A0ABX0K960_9PROT|nr:hypothetical protein [Acetobacter fallax]NHO31743.1 hypothetical protein [Acetobacter fallax]NHO35302.1 hypothetical protein [Acetobacter fallax]
MTGRPDTSGLSIISPDNASLLRLAGWHGYRDAGHVLFSRRDTMLLMRECEDVV